MLYKYFWKSKLVAVIESSIMEAVIKLLPINCLSVFDHSVALALKWLKGFVLLLFTLRKIKIYQEISRHMLKCSNT